MRQPQVQLGKSPTQPKVIFRGVYGQPVFTRMRTQRMREAAQLLIHMSWTKRPGNSVRRTRSREKRQKNHNPNLVSRLGL